MALSINRPPSSLVLPPFFLSFAIHFLTDASPVCDPLCVSRRRFEREREREREGGREREENLYRSYATDPHAIIGFLRRIDIALCLLISILTSL